MTKIAKSNYGGLHTQVKFFYGKAVQINQYHEEEEQLDLILLPLKVLQSMFAEVGLELKEVEK